MDARDITAGRHHTTLAAADNDRLVADGRIVALLDGGIKRIAIDMGDGQAVAFRVGH